MTAVPRWEVNIVTPTGEVAVCFVYPEYFKHDRRPADMIVTEQIKRTVDEMFYREGAK